MLPSFKSFCSFMHFYINIDLYVKELVPCLSMIRIYCLCVSADIINCWICWCLWRETMPYWHGEWVEWLNKFLYNTMYGLFFYGITLIDGCFTTPGGCLNIKIPSYQYRDSHVKDKTVSPTVLSLTWESPYLGKTVFILRRGPGSYFNINTISFQLWGFHYKDNDGNPYACKVTSLYWKRPLVVVSSANNFLEVVNRWFCGHGYWS